MMAGQTDIPVGTVATSADVATDDGSISGSDATTGAILISRGAELRTASAARYATNATLAAMASHAAFDGRIGCGTGAPCAEMSRRRASSRARKSGDGSMVGRLRTNMRLRRTTVS